jgi:hypothetical protein
METEPSPEQRIAYKDWLLADEAAIDASDAVLKLIQAGQALADLDRLERLSTRANELRAAADRALHKAMAALHHRGPTIDTESDSGSWKPGEETRSRAVAMIRTIVNVEVHQISRRSYERHDEPVDSQR